MESTFSMFAGKAEGPKPFFAWVFRFGRAVETVKPVDLKDKYIDMISDILKKHEIKK